MADATSSHPLTNAFASPPGDVVDPTNSVNSTLTARKNSTASGAKGKKRVRNFTADDRAAHRVFEKSRREAFKKRLVVGSHTFCFFCAVLVDGNLHMATAILLTRL
jgi:hypothetical protein